MGCDIHLVTQVKENGKWVIYPTTYKEDRNYSLFSVLAGVRQVGEVVPIAEPRGIPEDFGYGLNNDFEIDGIKEEFDSKYNKWLGDHSFSWLSLSELRAFDFSQESFVEFGITNEQFITASKFGQFAGKQRDGRFLMTEEIYPHFSMSSQPYVECVAPVSYYDLAGGCFFIQIFDMEKLCREKADNSSGDNVRIVFGFDN